MVDRGKNGDNFSANHLYPDHALLRRGKPHVGGKRLTHFHPQTFEASGGKQSCIMAAVGNARQSGGDIAAQKPHNKVATQPLQLRGATRAGCADARAMRQSLYARRPDQPVAHIGARQYGCQLKCRVAQRFDILHRMDGGIDFPVQHGAIQFTRPQRLAANIGERPVLYLVAAGHHRHQFDRVRIPPMRRNQRVTHHFGLPQRQWRCARAQTDGKSGACRCWVRHKLRT